MAWSTPLTAVSNTALTAAQWNASVRDNLLTTAPALATTVGSLFVGTGANAIAERVPATVTIATSENSGITAYGNLGATGPAVTAVTGTKAIGIWGCTMGNATGGQNNYMSVAVSGASTAAASDAYSVRYQSWGSNARGRASTAHMWTTLTAGTNTFTSVYRVDASTGTFSDRELIVIPL